MKQNIKWAFIFFLTISLVSCSVSQYKNESQNQRIVTIEQGEPGDPCAYNEIWMENNKLVEMRCLGPDKKLQKDERGVAIRKQRYSGGYMIESSHYGRDERLKEDTSGIAILRFKWEKGKKIEVRRYGTDGNLKENKNGIAISRNFYDENDHWIESRNYGLDGKLKENKMGVAISRFKRDAKGRVTELSYYDLNGNLTENKESGCAIERLQWNNERRSINEECLDRDFKLVRKE